VSSTTSTRLPAARDRRRGERARVVARDRDDADPLRSEIATLRERISSLTRRGKRS